MTHIDCTPFLPASSLGLGRVRRLIRRVAPVIAPALTAAVLGCREDVMSPTAVEREATLDATPARGLAFRQVSAGDGHTCGVTNGNAAYCWGANISGELGDGSNTGPEGCSTFGDAACSTRPVRVVGGLAFRQVSAGGSHSCGLTTSKAAYCWGDNALGELGAGTDTGPEECGTPCSTRPVAVVPPARP